MKPNYGFNSTEILEGEHYIMGDGKLTLPAIMPDGHGWKNFLPLPERIQNQNGVETEACTCFALIDALSPLFRQRFGQLADWSDRFLAIISGTDTKGNNPQSVADAFRNNGTVDYNQLPFDQSILNVTDFYLPNPLPANLIALAKFWLTKWEMGHAWVCPDTFTLEQKQLAMKTALQYSPLTAGVFAWEQRPDGLYENSQNLPPCHDVCVYDYVEGVSWQVFDSYDNTHKSLVWEFPFSQIKVYALDVRGPDSANPLAAAVQSVLQWLAGLWKKREGATIKGAR